MYCRLSTLSPAGTNIFVSSGFSGMWAFHISQARGNPLPTALLFPLALSYVSFVPLRDVAHSVPASREPHVRRPARGPLQAQRSWLNKCAYAEPSTEEGKTIRSIRLAEHEKARLDQWQ